MLYRRTLSFIPLLFIASLACATTWHVGPSRQYTMPSKVMSLVASGDTVEIDPGLYSGDVGTWRADSLVIRSTSGFAHLEANGKNAQGKAIWVVAGKHTYIEGIEFSGCSVPDSNGAGIRQEGNGLELRRCFFHDNQNGILGGGDTTSDVLIESCEFARNGVPKGTGAGYAHNMYITHVHSFTLKYCYSHQAWAGHDVKTRARNNYILYNLILDSADGTASYNVDIPNGGRAIVMGNIFWKGPKALNETLLAYGEELVTNPDSELFVVNNTMITERANSEFVENAGTSNRAKIKNNIFAGPTRTFNDIPVLYYGRVDTASNVYSLSPSFFAFQDSARFKFSPLFHFPGMRNVAPADTSEGFVLVPTEYYYHPMSSQPVGNQPRYVGACPALPLGVESKKWLTTPTENYPNPFTTSTRIALPANTPPMGLHVQIMDEKAGIVRAESGRVIGGEIEIDRRDLSPGTYYFHVLDAQNDEVAFGKMAVAGR